MSLWDVALYDQAPFDLGTERVTSLLIGSLVSGIDYLPSTKVGSLSITKETDGGVHTLTAQIAAPAGACPITAGDVVACYGYGTTLFTGYVSRITPKLHGWRNGEWWNLWTITCQDDTRYLEATQTGQEVYSDVYDGEILRTLVATYLTGFDTSNISDIVSIPDIDLSGKTLRECFDEVAKMAGAIWYLQPEKVIWYHSIGDVIAPFGLAADADSVSAKAVLAADLSVEEEFTGPVNKCYVRNMLAEEVAQASYVPSASGDDGDVSRASSTTEYPPTGAYTVDGSSVTMTARRQKVLPSTGQISPSVSGVNSGSLYKWGTSYPPGNGPTLSEDYQAECSYSEPSDLYNRMIAVMFFDTSSLPDDCEVTAAALDCGLDHAEDGESGAEFSMGWYSGSNAPIDTSDYTSSTSEGAYSYTALSGSITSPLALKNFNSQISRTGYTGLRAFVRCPSGAPAGLNSISIGSPQLVIDYSYGGNSYKVTCALVRFNTEPLPDTAQVTGATLTLNITAKADADSAQVGIEYISDPGALGNEDWTNTTAESAYAYKALSELPASGTWSIPLLSPAANISLTGYTALRIHIKTTTTPTGDNSLTLSTVDSANDPSLAISYVPGAMIEGSSQDTDSIAEHGTFEKSIINTALVSEAEADLQAQGEVLRYAWPIKTIRATCFDYGLDIGQLVQFISPQFGLTQSYVIRRLSIIWKTRDELQFTIEAGDYRPDLIRFLRGAI